MPLQRRLDMLDQQLRGRIGNCEDLVQQRLHDIERQLRAQEVRLQEDRAQLTATLSEETRRLQRLQKLELFLEEQEQRLDSVEEAWQAGAVATSELAAGLRELEQRSAGLADRLRLLARAAADPRECSRAVVVEQDVAAGGTSRTHCIEALAQRTAAMLEEHAVALAELQSRSECLEALKTDCSRTPDPPAVLEEGDELAFASVSVDEDANAPEATTSSPLLRVAEQELSRKVDRAELVRVEAAVCELLGPLRRLARRTASGEARAAALERKVEKLAGVAELGVIERPALSRCLLPAGGGISAVSLGSSSSLESLQSVVAELSEQVADLGAQVRGVAANLSVGDAVSLSGEHCDHFATATGHLNADLLGEGTVKTVMYETAIVAALQP